MLPGQFRIENADLFGCSDGGIVAHGIVVGAINYKIDGEDSE